MIRTALAATALILVTGCQPGAGTKPPTPEQQQYMTASSHCESVARVEITKMDAMLPDNTVTFAGGYARQAEISRAGNVAYHNCMAQYGYWP
jgi:hypothetical protein